MQYRGLKLTEHEGQFFFEDLELEKEYDPEKRYQAFIEKHALSVSRAVSPSINHLLKGRIGSRKAGDGYIDQTIEEDKGDYPDALGWFDNTHLFYHSESKSYVLTTQPYGLRLNQFKALEAFCDENGLSCTISYEDAWKYPGRTPLVIICRSEVMPSIFNRQVR